MLGLLLKWFFSALSILIIAWILPGIRIKNFGTALAVAAVYGVLHLLLYRVVAFIAFIPMVITFGLFALVINAFILFLTDKLIKDFEINSFTTTFVAAVLLSLINSGFRLLFLSY